MMHLGERRLFIKLKVRLHSILIKENIIDQSRQRHRCCRVSPNPSVLQIDGDKKKKERKDAQVHKSLSTVITATDINIKSM